MTVAGTPVNMPTHAHSQGYSDINFLIPELVAGVQHSKGPYFADQGDFPRGRGNITMRPCSTGRSSVSRPAISGFGRVFAARRRRSAMEPCLRRSRARQTPAHGPCPTRTRSSTACCATRGATTSTASRSPRWDITESGTPRRPPAARDRFGLIDRFGSIDQTDGGHTSRYSVGGEWQHGTGATLTKIQAYGLGYDLNRSRTSRFTWMIRARRSA